MAPLVRGLSSMATRQLLAELGTAVGTRLGLEVVVTSAGGVDIARRVRQGEVADVLVLARDALDALVLDGLVLAASVRPLFRSDVVAAVPEGSSVAGIPTEEALRDEVRRARRVAYSTGPSGTAVLELVRRWGLIEELEGRLRLAPPGVPVGALLSSGEADLGFQQRSELAGIDGVRVLGALPPGTEITSVFAGGVLATTAHRQAAHDVLDAFGAPSVGDVVERHGMEPVSGRTGPR